MKAVFELDPVQKMLLDKAAQTPGLIEHLLLQAAMMERFDVCEIIKDNYAEHLSDSVKQMLRDSGLHGQVMTDGVGTYRVDADGTILETLPDREADPV